MFSNTVILVGEPKRFCGDLRLANTPQVIAAPVLDTWSDFPPQQFGSLRMRSWSKASGNVWAILARAPMGVCQTTFGISPASQEIVQREEPGIPPNIQKALWSGWSAFADHTGYLSLGAFWTCFLVREQSSGLPRDMAILPLAANSIQTTASILDGIWALDKFDAHCVLSALRHFCQGDCGCDPEVGCSPCETCYYQDLMRRLKRGIPDSWLTDFRFD